MDYLKPADMPAVLERTKLKANEENFLLPIYEAVSNAIYSAQNRWGIDVSAKGQVSVTITTGSFQAVIADNGVGLDEVNYGHFLTPFTGFRLKRGGKGFGRFIAFKVFDDIAYASRFDSEKREQERAFSFNIYDEPQITDELISKPSLNFDKGCVVRYREPKEEFAKIGSALSGEDIVERTIRLFPVSDHETDRPNCLRRISGTS